MQKSQIERDKLKKHYKDSLLKKDIVINNSEIIIDLVPIVKLLQIIHSDNQINKQA